MPDTDPASPAFIKERRSRIEYGMTPFLDSLILNSYVKLTLHIINNTE